MLFHGFCNTCHFNRWLTSEHQQPGTLNLTHGYKKFNPWLTLTSVRATEANPRLTFNHWLRVNHFSSNRGQMVTCSNRAGNINLFPTTQFKRRMQICCLMWRAIVFKGVLSLKPKIFTKKSISLEKLANGRYDFEVQPTATIVIDS